MIAEETPYFHGSDKVLVKEDLNRFLHLGTIKQVRSRWPTGIIHKVTISQNAKFITMRDKGSWRHEDLMRAARRGSVVKYLNRYEGIDLDELEIAARCDDKSDSVFKRHVRSARESLIILSPEIIKTIEIIKI